MNGNQTLDSVIASETRRENVYNLLMSDGGWHTTAEINSVEVGGTEGTRRLRELRARLSGGFVIEKRKAQGSTMWEYRIIQNRA